MHKNWEKIEAQYPDCPLNNRTCGKNYKYIVPLIVICMFILCFYLLILAEASGSDTLKFTKHSSRSAESMVEEVVGTRQEAPVIHIVVECYHDETVGRSKKRIISHTQTKELPYSFIMDASGTLRSSDFFTNAITRVSTSLRTRDFLTSAVTRVSTAFRTRDFMTSAVTRVSIQHLEPGTS